MSSTIEFVQYVADQLSLAGDIAYRRLFGEYGLYCDGKFFGTVEDTQFFIKITEPGGALLTEPVIASPHEGSRMDLIENLDDRAFLAQLVQTTCQALPAPKPKKRRPKKEDAPHA